MLNPTRNQVITQPLDRRREEEISLVAQQRFISRRKLNFTEIARKTGYKPPTVKLVAMGVLRNEKIMTALLDEWRKVVADTREYEFWRAA